jgi:hypothetical protein
MGVEYLTETSRRAFLRAIGQNLGAASAVTNPPIASAAHGSARDEPRASDLAMGFTPPAA